VIDDLPLTEVSVSAGVAAAVALIALVDRRADRDLLVLWAGATAAFLVGLDHAPRTLLLAVAVTVVASIVSDPAARLALLALGLGGIAVVLPATVGDGLQVGTLVAVAAVGPLLSVAYRRAGLALTLILIGGTAIGVYVNVPDTEQIALIAPGLALLGGGALVLAPLRRTSVWFGSLATVGALVMWAGAVGARGRPASYVAVIGALGVLVAEPVAARVRPGTDSHPVVQVMVHAVAVLVVSRVASERSVGSALVIVAIAWLAAIIALSALPRRAAQDPAAANRS